MAAQEMDRVLRLGPPGDSASGPRATGEAAPLAVGLGAIGWRDPVPSARPEEAPNN